MVRIEIEDPEYALRVLNRLYPADWGKQDPPNKDVHRWMADVQKKIERAVIEEKTRDVWRVITEFPRYEMSGGCLIRDRQTRDQIEISATGFDPVVVHLYDVNGMSHEIPLGDLYLEVFTELKVLSGNSQD